MSRRRRQKSINSFWILIIIVCFVLIYWIWKDKDNLFKKNSTTTITTTTTLSLKPISFEPKQITKEGNTYNITINYPHFQIDFIDQNINQFVNSQIDDFINDFGSVEIFNNNKNTLDVIFDAYLISDNWVSLRFINVVYTGGAHGNQQIITKNFNLLTKQEVQLKHLFKNDTYLTFLSEKAIAKFIADNISQESWIKDGASAKYDNFENFTYSNDGKSVIFHFDPYQIAPYSAGILTLDVSKSELTSFLK